MASVDGTSSEGSEHVQGWLKKLKESQDRKKDEKIRKYNDVVSRLIILLIGVCIVCVIVIAALIVQNEGQKKSFDQLVLANQTTFESQQGRVNALQSQVQTLQEQNERFQAFILSNRTLDIDHQVRVIDPMVPNLTQIAYNNSQITLYFLDGSSKTTDFKGADFTV